MLQKIGTVKKVYCNRIVTATSVTKYGISLSYTSIPHDKLITTLKFCNRSYKRNKISGRMSTLFFNWFFYRKYAYSCN